jgi:hypothetical protein
MNALEKSLVFTEHDKFKYESTKTGTKWVALISHYILLNEMAKHSSFSVKKSHYKKHINFRRSDAAKNNPIARACTARVVAEVCVCGGGGGVSVVHAVGVECGIEGRCGRGQHGTCRVRYRQD